MCINNEKVNCYVPIVFACDDNFLPQTYVAMYSILKNRKSDDFIKFYVIVPESLKAKRLDEKWEFENYEIEYIHVSEDAFAERKMSIVHISRPTYYRLLIPQLLEEEKCIYLDGDILCCGDITELYNQKIDDYLLGGVKGAVINFNKSFQENLMGYLGTESVDGYINAGVLLMNLEKMREENIVAQFLECSKLDWPSQDQDVINIVCYGKIKHLHAKFNLYSRAFNMPMEQLLFRYTPQEISEALEKPYLIHYADEFTKPWCNMRTSISEEWWNMASEALSEEFTNEMWKQTKRITEQYSLKEIVAKYGQCKEAIVFGYTKVGKNIFDFLTEEYGDRIIAFMDNDSDKAGEEYRGRKVYLPETIERKQDGVLIVIATQKSWREVQNQLLNIGYKAEQLIVYRVKHQNYFYSIDKKYLKEAIEELKIDRVSWKQLQKEGVKLMDE